jgi:biotin carboxylase
VTGLPRVAIVYDIGAAVPIDILADLDGIAEPVFVLPDTEHGRHVAGLLVDLAEVCDVDGVGARRPDGITTFSDFQLDTTARLATDLGLPFHSPGAAADITRKFRQRTLLNAAGVGPVPTALVTDARSAAAALAAVPLPAVLKPNRGVGGTDTYPIDAGDELWRLLDRLPGLSSAAPDDGYVLESRLVAAPVEDPWAGFVSVESVVHGGDVEHVGVTGKFGICPPFRERGGYVPPRPGEVDQTAVFDLAGRALAALRVGDSVCHTEIMLTADGPRIIEVNGRAGGHVVDLFRRGYGISLIELAARLALGEKPDLTRTEPAGVAYHCFGIAPAAATRLVQATGLAAARDLPEVERLDLTVDIGSFLDWRRGFRERIYTCRGTVNSHDELAAFLPRLERLLGLAYECDEPGDRNMHVS